MILIIVFWSSIILLAHTYLLYPLFLQIFSVNKKGNQLVYKDNYPSVSIVMSVHNEERVIVKKIESIYETTYPVEKLEVIIGSDASNDATNDICQKYRQNYPGLHFYPFEKRSGKPSVINSLADKAKGEILIITDANVIFIPGTIPNLVKHFRNPAIGLVDTIMTHSGLKKKGIALQENAYINREVRIKQNESKLMGAMMGPFGGCYALRRKLFSRIPENFLVDDFYINMTIIEKGKQSINSRDSFVIEDVSHNLKDEFYRKIRIATGNYQNLRRFAHLLIRIWEGPSFAFLSHKVIRWLGPFLMIAAFISNLFLLDKPFYQLTFAIQIGLISLSVIDLLVNLMNINFYFFRLITHFFSMNMALFIGFFKYLSGVKTGIWQPTRRNQGE